MNTFPSYPGLGWDIKKRVLFSNARETSTSGAEFSTARWPIPHYEFDVDYNFLSQADRDSMEAFYEGQLGGHVPFLLAATNDNAKVGATLTPAPNGTNKIFQIVGMKAQTNVTGVPAVKDNGAAAGANTVSALGVVTFTTAPIVGHTLTADYSYAYVVRFKDDKMEFNQLMNRMYENKKVSFRTVR